MWSNYHNMASELFPFAGGLLWIGFSIFFVCITWYSARDWGRVLLLNAKGQLTHGEIIDYRSNYNRTARHYVTCFKPAFRLTRRRLWCVRKYGGYECH